MLEPNRVKQTARKSTGGKAPKPRASSFHGSGSSRSSPTIQRRGVGPTLQHSGQFDYNTSPVMDESNKQVEQWSGGQRGSRHSSVHELNESQMWSAPTSNIRGVKEPDEPAPGPSAPSTLNTSKGRSQCTRCSRMRIICEPISGSRKCSRCYQDHQLCSWAADVPRPASHQPSPSKGRAPAPTEDIPISGSESSDLELDELEKDEKFTPRKKTASTPSKNGYPQEINGKCLRCASFSNNPVCERSDDPFDLKCKKCRRDKQSCSFAPYGGRRRPISKAKPEETSEDETDEDSEQETDRSTAKRAILEGARAAEKSPGAVEQRADAQGVKGKEKEKSREKSVTKADKPKEKGKDLERPRVEKREDKAKGHIKAPERGGVGVRVGSGQRKIATGSEKGREGKKQGNVKEWEKDKTFKTSEAVAERKRKMGTELDEGNGHPKKKFMSRSSEPRKTPMANPRGSTSSSSGIAGAPTSSPSLSRMIMGWPPVPTASEAQPEHVERRTPAPRSSTLVEEPSMQLGTQATRALVVVQRVADRGVQERSKGTSSRAPSQPIPMDVDENRSLAVIERELSAAEQRASMYRTLAESILKDAETADQEVATLKEELIAAVRRNTSVEGSVVERRRLIEMLGSRSDA